MGVAGDMFSVGNGPDVHPETSRLMLFSCYDAPNECQNAGGIGDTILTGGFHSPHFCIPTLVINALNSLGVQSDRQSFLMLSDTSPQHRGAPWPAPLSGANQRRVRRSAVFGPRVFTDGARGSGAAHEEPTPREVRQVGGKASRRARAEEQHPFGAPKRPNCAGLA